MSPRNAPRVRWETAEEALFVDGALVGCIEFDPTAAAGEWWHWDTFADACGGAPTRRSARAALLKAVRKESGER